MDINSLLYAIPAALIGAYINHFFQRKGDRAKVTDEEFARVVKDVQQLKITAVNEIRVREIIRDAIEPTSNTVKEIKDKMDHFGNVLQDIQVKLAAELAYKRGRQDKEGD